MLEPLLTYRGVNRLYEYNPSKKFLDELIETYDLHELVEDDIVEPNTQDKIDVYHQCLFVVLHFPKYDKAQTRYLQNEFNMIVGKNYLITLSTYMTDHVMKLKQWFAEELSEAEADEKHKFSPYYLMYIIMDTMYDKTIRTLQSFTKDLRTMEDVVFKSPRLDKSLLEQIMIKKRNAVTLKHMFMPHQEIVWLLQEEMLKFFWGELDVYFEDLAYKIDKILNTVEILHEDIESLYDTYNAMVNMRTNTIITVLTIFTALTGIMTLISGIFGMNVPLPWADLQHAIRIIVATMIVVAVGMVGFFRWKKWL
jgi:magnesium transporter